MKNIANPWMIIAFLAGLILGFVFSPIKFGIFNNSNNSYHYPPDFSASEDDSCAVEGM